MTTAWGAVYASPCKPDPGTHEALRGTMVSHYAPNKNVNNEFVLEPRQKTQNSRSVPRYQPPPLSAHMTKVQLDVEHMKKKILSVSFLPWLSPLFHTEECA